MTYFDKDKRKWMIMERSGRVQHRTSSPLAERQTFAIFDEARCRGSDLKLRPDAVGLLTLSQGMTKDKLMQAAWRLRKLEQGQSLKIIAPADVMAKIRQACSLPGAGAKVEVRHVLTWVMINTIDVTGSGLVEWARQGLHFAGTKGQADRAMQQEHQELLDAYGGAREQQEVGRVVEAMTKRAVVGMTADAQELAQRVCSSAQRLGQGCHVITGRGEADEECEREMEQEQQKVGGSAAEEGGEEGGGRSGSCARAKL